MLPGGGAKRMLLSWVIGAACVIQLAAAVAALRVLRVTGRWPAWIVISAVAFLMAARRCLVFYYHFLGEPRYVPHALGEWIALAISICMLVGVSRISPFFLAIRRSQEELRERRDQLAARVRELNCLYAISTLVERQGDALDHICEGVTRLLADCLRQPVVVRISLDGRVFQSSPGEVTQPCWRREVTAGKRTVGEVQAWCPNATSQASDAFSVEERRLLDAVSVRLGQIVERAEAVRVHAALQQQLHQAQKMEAVGQLAAAVAHDFNNLLTVILGHAAVGQKLPAEHPAREALRTIETVAQRASSVADSLLRFAGQLPSEKCPLNLSALVREAGRWLRQILPEAIQLVVEVDEEPPVWINGDATQLQQVILNLALNARDAMPEGGRLSLVVRGEALPQPAGGAGVSRVCLMVSDTGTGMSAEVLERIFDPFFTTKPRGTGTGLGLSVVHGIVEDHGGTITVESQPGAGATFRVHLPTCSAPTSETSLPPRSMLHGQGERVVVAEQQALVRQLFVTGLSELGYTVLPCADAEALVAQCRQPRLVDLLIVERGILAAMGADGLGRLRAGGLVAPVIVLTSGLADVDNIGDEEVVVLRKPFALSTLSGLVREVLDTHAAAETKL